MTARLAMRCGKWRHRAAVVTPRLAATITEFWSLSGIMRYTISKRLAPLASLAAQRRYIVQGTHEEYLIPSDLLNDASDVIRQVRTMPAASDALPALSVQAFLDLDRLLDAAADAARRTQSNEQLVEHDAAWRALREQVAFCLNMAGFDLATWEKTEGLSPDA